MNTLKNRIRNREFVAGGWVSFSDPGIAETFALAGFDFVAIDLEHTVMSLKDAKEIIVACHSAGVPCYPRPVSHNNDIIKPLLESGADGMLFPMVQNARDVEALVDSMYFTPLGKRSYGVNRAHNYGLNFDQYIESWNEKCVLIPQIESVEAVDNIDEIVAHDCVDAAMVGPYDLSGSLGVPGQTESALVLDACEKVIEACKKAGKGCCTQIQTPTEKNIKFALDKGFTFTILGSDLFIVADWAKKTTDLAERVRNERT